MESYIPFTELPHIMPNMDANESYNLYNSSLPADHPFVTRTQDQFAVLPLEAQVAVPPYSQQTCWETVGSPYSTDYLSEGTQSYGDSLSPWDSGLSTFSDPQSPPYDSDGLPTPNYYESPRSPYKHSLFFDSEAFICSTPENLGHIESSLAMPKHPAFEYQPDYTPVHGTNIWSNSHTACNPTPETRCCTKSNKDYMATAHRSKPRTSSTSRVRKSTEKRTASKSGRRRPRAASNLSNGEESRTFICSFAPYGCESTFVSKNEWKRHVTSKHLLLGFYRCDVGKCKMYASPSRIPSASPSHSIHSHPAPQPGQPNDFNRKDLFTQHQRRMHAPWSQNERRVPTESERGLFEFGLEDIRQRCWQGLRQPPMQSHCGFCKKIFTGPGSWEVRMEHVGRHFERDESACLRGEEEDVALREWGLNEGILTVVNGQCRLASLN
ncbi:hypothetical protein N7452_002719 [Penicillium brevicompactum]|uniref:C2H2-type domain-containing protein n=1 Tax=Penicillium brevicompactum TaxID=5074 RepID=A0A9W9QS93_PENBR|nr:hypothetical protein N7452_002719 [Penicillium brevicompactum]